MKKTVSLTWPWNWSGSRWSFEKTIEEVVALNPDSVAIRAFDGPFEYGTAIDTRLMWGLKTYRSLEAALKAFPKRIEVDLWGPIYTKLWEAEARLQRTWLLPYYNEENLFADVEGALAAASLPLGLGPFLRSLGRMSRIGKDGVPTRVKVWLQSYRRENYHKEMLASKWLSYKDPVTGEYVVDGIAAQLYPMGWLTPAQYVEQTALDVASWQKVAVAVGRPDIPWFPTLPTFIDQAWTATVGGVQAQVEWLLSNLGERVHGINFWSLDQNAWEIPGMCEYTANLHLPGAESVPEPDAPMSVAEILDDHEQRIERLEGVVQP